MYPTDFTVPSTEELHELANGMVRYHIEQIEESEHFLANELFNIRCDIGPDAFNEMTDYLGISRGVAQSYLNVGLTNFMHWYEEEEIEEENI